MIKELTEGIERELDNLGGAECRRLVLTGMHRKGYDIKPYLIEILNNSGDEKECEKFGFQKGHGMGSKLMIYHLGDNKSRFYFEGFVNIKDLSRFFYKSWF